MLKLLRDNAGNPKNFFSYISTSGDYNISEKFLAEVYANMLDKYNGNGDIVEIRIEHNKDIKITGFKHDEIKKDVAKIIDKAKAYNFPPFWENIIELLMSKEQAMMKDIV